jgi:lipopolysaccharide biosynthesis regulator YciM
LSCALGPNALDQYDDAVSLAERAVAHHSEASRASSTLGAILYRAGRLDEAIARLTTSERFETASAEDRRSSPYTCYYLAMANHAHGNAKQASQWLAKAMDRTDKPVNHDPIAWIHAQKRKAIDQTDQSAAQKILQVPFWYMSANWTNDGLGRRKDGIWDVLWQRKITLQLLRQEARRLIDPTAKEEASSTNSEVPSDPLPKTEAKGEATRDE